MKKRKYSLNTYLKEFKLNLSVIKNLILCVRDAISCMDWCSGILATGSWDATVKVWQCNELNGYLVNIEHDFLAQLDHNSQVLLCNF